MGIHDNGRDAKPQLFTETLRDYLQGKDVKNPSDAKARVINRILYTFSDDFDMLSELDKEHRDEIFEFKPLAEGLAPSNLETDRVTPHDISAYLSQQSAHESLGLQLTGEYEKSGSDPMFSTGVWNLIRFLYLGYREQNRRDEFLTLFQSAIRNAEAEYSDIEGGNVEVNLSVDTHYDLDEFGPLEKYQRDLAMDGAEWDKLRNMLLDHVSQEELLEKPIDELVEENLLG